MCWTTQNLSLDGTSGVFSSSHLRQIRIKPFSWLQTIPQPFIETSRHCCVCKCISFVRFNMCWTVGQGLSQSGHLASVLILHCHKFRGVGSVFNPALSRKDNYPAGNPFQIHFWTFWICDGRKFTLDSQLTKWICTIRFWQWWSIYSFGPDPVLNWL